MMRKKAALCLIIGVVLIAFFAGGCAKNDKDDLTEKIAAYLHEEYNDNFTFVSSGNENWTADYSEIIYSSEKLNENITVWYYSDEKILDNYMSVSYKDETEQFVLPFAEDIYGSCMVVNTPIHYGKEHFKNTLTFADYISDARSDICISIATDRSPETKESDADQLANSLSATGMSAYIRIFYYDNDDYDSLRVNDSAAEIFQPLSENCLTIKINEDRTYTIE